VGQPQFPRLCRHLPSKHIMLEAITRGDAFVKGSYCAAGKSSDVPSR
jgi:hypothetical protein